MQLTELAGADDASGSTLPPKTRLDAAIQATRGFLRSIFRRGDDYQPEDVLWSRKTVRARDEDRDDETRLGYWIGELEADTTLESDYILFLYFLDKEAYRDKIRKLANFIRTQQLEDGSWNIFHNGPPEISASVKAYFALKLAGYAVDEPFMKKARDAILRMGGAENVNNYTKIYLSFLNQFNWKEIPAIPPEIILLPRFFYFNVYEISYWSRAILIPLSILYAKKPNHKQTPEVTIEEIFAGSNGNNGRTDEASDRVAADHIGAPAADAEASMAVARDADSSQAEQGHPAIGSNGASFNDAIDSSSATNGGLKIPKDPNLLSWRNFFVLVDRILRLIEKTPLKPLRGIALKKAEAWVISRSEDSDGLGAIFPSMVNSVMAMRCLGHDESHPCFATNLKKLQELEIEDGDCIRLQPCLSPVWDTGLVINALVEAGAAPDEPEIIEGARWLLTKEVRKPGDWNQRVRGVETSGWPFQFRNEFYPDVDDTAAVLLALERCDHTKVPGLEDSITRGLNWTLNMQCSNGGWAAFDVDIDHALLTHVPYADHNAMLDPACADITGRVLEMLGRFPDLRSNPVYRDAIARGVKYLVDSQLADGSWFGRWGVNYIYGTWQAVKGLMAVGENPQAPHVRKAVAWLVEHQNSDGGWGETCDSYRDVKLSGRGTSTVSQTSWAVMALVATGSADSPAVEQGVDFLLRRQKSDGTWDEDEFTGTGFPDVFYLRYHLYRVTFPLFALGYYRNVKYSQKPIAAPAKTIPLARAKPRGLDLLSLRSLRGNLFRGGSKPETDGQSVTSS